MSRHEYYATALQYAKDHGLTPAQVMSAGFAAVATASGLDPSAPPADFFYAAIRRRVAKRLLFESDEAQTEARRIAIRAKVRELLDLTDAEVEKIEDRAWLVRLP